MAILRVFSDDDKLHDFMKDLKLPISESFRKGDKITGSLVRDEHGFIVDINDDAFYELDKQIRSVIEFFKTYKSELAKLKVPDYIVEKIVSFTGKLPDSDDEIMHQRNVFSNELLKLLAESGFSLELSLYPGS